MCFFCQIERTGGSIGQVEVQWELTQDSNNDFVDRNGTVIFGSLITRADLPLKVRGDTVPELDEVFDVQLTAVSKVKLNIKRNYPGPSCSKHC